MTRNLFYILLASAALSLSPVAQSVATAQDSQDTTILPKTGTKSGSGETQKQKTPDTKSMTKQSSGESGSSDTQSTVKPPKAETTQKSGSGTDTQQSTTSSKTQMDTDQSKSATDTSGTAKTGSQTNMTQENTAKSSTTNTNITVEQQTQVRQVIKEVHTTPVRESEIKTVSVGVSIPHSIRLEPLPPRIVKIIPQYKSYRFFVLADGRIVIVDPNSFTIVYVLEA
ncbi:DUF1236 domain-containing protein [Rhizobium sp. CNPSo 3464]|uniref:DUF1236 domain-containing protein n=1 Tax=Rhizobium sp. CNPSo 3464 TaxID=3021406 RepID=UPI00254D3720|nr:DUF1236 domain-containing protein [Rhizobium sp. CNPSo 3464]MDK4742661.1 DUF1236 domain-containing protein [Rhizobium sp. CNPSo 3464]